MSCSKQEIRNKKLAQRKLLTKAAVQVASKAVCSLLMQQAWFNKATNIACYYAINNELNAALIIQHIWQANKNCYLPIINNNSLIFAEYKQNTNLIKSKFNTYIPEDIVQTTKLDLILLPVVAFTTNGARLGWGKGHYDATISAIKTKPLLVGLAYEFQKTTALPQDPWDVKLDAIITEQNMYGVTV